jgi:Sec-independent protein secretion pathway component TatC
MTNITEVKRTNAVAMVAIVMVFFNPVAGLILGHIALVQIKRTGDEGRAAALLAAVIGWVLSGLLLLGLIGALIAGSLLAGFAGWF